jgi:hypothetical protein
LLNGLSTAFVKKVVLELKNTATDKPNRKQIPTEYNEEGTLSMLRKQEHMPGGRRDKTVSDFPKAAALAQILKDLEFPADKKQIEQFVEQSDKPENNEILSIVKNLDDKQYQNVSDVTEAARLVSK